MDIKENQHKYSHKVWQLEKGMPQNQEQTNRMSCHEKDRTFSDNSKNRRENRKDLKYKTGRSLAGRKNCGDVC